MTLVKSKPRRPSTAHRQRTGQHHHHSHHYVKAYWPYLPILAVLLFGLVSNSWLGQLHRSVLGYATDMSAQGLLNGTNAQRSANSEGALSLNAALNQAAQAKANDMAARNYWSHNTPDGQTPWSFIASAGYDYVTAGENLAYGFSTSADTISGWMNSPEHRANILNTSYRDVGFGIVNISDYQSTGPETLVVAMYGSLNGEAAAASTPAAPVAPAPQPKPENGPATAPTSSPAADSSPASPAPVPSPSIATSKPAQQAPVAATHSDTLRASPAEPPQQRISRIQLVARDVSWSVASVTIIGAAAILFLLLRHGLAWHKVWLRSERFVLRHPAFDIMALTVLTISFILSHTSGFIR
jgi:uncharacterized protein YkwD